MLDIIPRRSQSGADAPDRRRDPRFRGPRKRGDHTVIKKIRSRNYLKILQARPELKLSFIKESTLFNEYISYVLCSIVDIVDMTLS